MGINFIIIFSRGGGRNGNGTNITFKKGIGKSPVLTMELHILYLNDTPACGQIFFFFFFNFIVIGFLRLFSLRVTEKKENR